jgi:hypothetical protein
MARKLAASTVVTNPNTGAPTVIEAGAEVPDWAEGLLEDHLFEADTPREVAEEADVDDNAKPAVALAEEAGTTAVGVNPTQVEPADAGVGGSPAEEPKKTAARRRKAADKGDDQSE